jgi:hypothetical protein
VGVGVGRCAALDREVEKREKGARSVVILLIWRERNIRTEIAIP